MVETPGFARFRPIEVRIQTEMMPPALVHTAPRHYRSRTDNPNFKTTKTKIVAMIPPYEFPVEEWNHLSDFDNWVLSRRDLFPNRFTWYYLLGRKTRPGRAKRHRRVGRCNFLPYIALCKFYIDEKPQVFEQEQRGVIKGSYGRKRGRYLIWDWFPRNKRY